MKLFPVAVGGIKYLVNDKDKTEGLWYQDNFEKTNPQVVEVRKEHLHINYE